MKAKALILSFGVLCLTVLAARAETSIDQKPSGHNALRKLGRGCSNLLFGVVEMPNQVTKVTSDKGGAAGVTYGIGKGLVRWFGREVVGVYEIVTFPVPFPHGYKPVMTPEFPNEDYEP
ncbi:MAG: exosortase system-associated protein, TIGR04073 family [Verrucomicrobiia bacterium]|jgi:putative exosortase-associated protein (TIGR04073 family)